MKKTSKFRRRVVAATFHLLVSLVVAALAAVLVFGLWYPGAYRSMAGGRELFVLITSVDVVLGPLLTFAVFNVSKGIKHLRFDLAVIGAVQLVALVYGLHTVYLVRPVAMVFEVDRLRMVTVLDVVAEELPTAAPEYRHLPLTGPWLLAARQPSSAAEQTDALFKGLSGKDIGQRPLFWQPYDMAKDRALQRSRPVKLLLDHYLDREGELRTELAAMKADEGSSRFLPVIARGDWVGILSPTGNVLGYLPFDGFF